MDRELPLYVWKIVPPQESILVIQGCLQKHHCKWFGCPFFFLDNLCFGILFVPNGSSRIANIRFWPIRVWPPTVINVRSLFVCVFSCFLWRLCEVFLETWELKIIKLLFLIVLEWALSQESPILFSIMFEGFQNIFFKKSQINLKIHF